MSRKIDYEQFSVLILSAGASNRFMENSLLPKFLHPITTDGQTWLELQIEAFVNKGFAKILTVFGYHLELIKKVAPILLEDRNLGESRVTPVINLQPHRGSFSSLQAGLKAVDFTNVLICPVDVPCPSQEDLHKLLNITSKSVILPRYNGKNGHPVCLSNDFCKYLLQYPTDNSDARLDFQIKKLPKEKVGYVDVSSREVILNLNRVKDFHDFFFGYNWI